MTELREYRVRMWPKHGPMHDIFVEAPDILSAREYAMRICPDQLVLGVKRKEEAVSEVNS